MPATGYEGAPFGGVWIVLPTYDEAANIEPISRAILAALPSATLLVVDDSSPDGTGEFAEALAARDARIRVLHRPQKEGLGRAYLDGFRTALGHGADVVVQMDADFSHDPASPCGPLEEEPPHRRRGVPRGARPAGRDAARAAPGRRPRPRAEGVAT